MPIVSGNVNIADVHKVLERAAQHILDARGGDKVASRSDIAKTLESLDGEERALVDMFYRFTDHRDAKPGARITQSDIDKTLAYAKRKLVERLDKDGDHELTNNEIGRMSRIGKLAVAIAQGAGATGGTGGTQGTGPTTFPADVQEAITKGYVEVTQDNAGHVTGVKVKSDFDVDEITPMFGKVLAAATGEHITQLNLGNINAYDSSDSFNAALEEIAKHGPFPNLKEVFIADVDQDESEISWIDVGGIGKVFDLSPDLERLHVKGGGASFSPTEHSGLTSIFFESGGLPGGVPRSLGASTLPNLESLELWLGTDEYGASTTMADLAGILQGDKMPKLKSLGLKNSDLSNDIAKAIVDAPVLAQLETIDLGMGTLTDEGAQALLDNKAKLGHLERINLDDNFLSPDMIAKLQDAFGNRVVIGDQSKYEDLASDPDYLYVSVGE